MGYRISHPRHRRGKACPVCTLNLERQLGIVPMPKPPAGPGPGQVQR